MTSGSYSPGCLVPGFYTDLPALITLPTLRGGPLFYKGGTMGFIEHPENINRKGRPRKGKGLSDILGSHAKKRDVEYIDPKTGERKMMSRNQALAAKLWDLALSGDITAIKYIYDRIDGKPQEFIETRGSIALTEAIRGAYERRIEK